MRVISQDGTMDIPYGNYSLFIIGTKYKDAEVACIFCRNSYAPGEKLAEYSTEEKAIKAMEMLKKAYENNEFYHYMSATDTFEKAVSYLSNEEFRGVTSEYFQFPQDDEIEV